MDYAQLSLSGGSIGVEREALRVQKNGQLATTPHPKGLGSAFSHPNITIDYGEALLELVTGVNASVESAYAELKALHQFCVQNLGDELLWSASMPCVLPEEKNIQIGEFGRSNSGKIKRLYREGLAHRYGKHMQMIAGIHFNYSPPSVLFDELARLENTENNQEFRNGRYMGMLRSIQRFSWLICYLYGASPAVDKSFVPAQSKLNPLHNNSLFWTNATTLRMSQLGYQNKVDFVVSFDNLEAYTQDLISAVLTPAPAYEYLGLKNPDGSYKQMSTNILQIENEYYASARPKQITKKGELPSMALRNRGIQYVELRLLDVNPYDPCGIDLSQMRFLETFLLWALLNPTPAFSSREINEQNNNRLRTACCGLNPDLELSDYGHLRPIDEWKSALLRQMLPLAEALSMEHAIAVEALLKAEPLARRVHRDLTEQEFIDWGLALSFQHQKNHGEALSENLSQYYQQLAKQSLSDFAEIERQAEHQISFCDYLKNYFQPLKNKG